MKKLLLILFCLVPFFLKAQTTTYSISGSSGNSPGSTNVSYACSPILSATRVILIAEQIGTSSSIKFYLAKNTNSCTPGGNSNFTGGTWSLFENNVQVGSSSTVGSTSSTTTAKTVTMNFGAGTRTYTASFTSTASGQTWNMSNITVTGVTVCNLTAPSTGSASSVSTTGFRANWNAISGASSYTINMATNSGSYPGTQVTTTNTYYDFSSLSSGTQYKYQVRANCSSTLFGNFGGTIDTPTTTALTCTTPSGLSTSNITETGYTATWSAVSGASTYSLETVPNANGYTGSLVNTSTNSYTFSSLINGGTYKFQVRTNCSNGISSVMSNSLLNIQLLSPLSLPTLTSPTSNQTLPNTTTSVTFQWSKNGNPAGTNYQFRLRNVTDNVVLYDYTPEGDVSSKTVTLSPGKEYSWVVRATKLGNVNKESAPSTFTISPKPITLGTIPTPITWHCDKTFTWSSVAGTGNVTLELWNTNVSTFNVIASNIANTGSFTWNVGKENGNLTDIVNFDVNNSYYLKIYPHNTTGQATQSGAFPIVTPTISVSQPTATNYVKGTSMNIAWATSTNYCGNLTIEYTNSSNTSLGVIVQNTPNDGSHPWTIPTTLADGQYKIKIYAPVSSGGSPVVQYSAIFNVVGTDPNCPNCITGQTEANFVQTGNEGFCAAQYLCSQKIIQATQPNPTNAILREDVAKITLIALLDNPATTDLYTNPSAVSFPADNFPVPYNDLSGSSATCCGSYHRYAKVLSYLDYGDGMPPFVRRASFNPTSTIQRIDLLQVYLEAWNIDETTASGITLYFNDLATANLSAQQLLYLKKAVQLGLVVNGTAATPISFRPTIAATREEAFLILKRLRTSTSVTKPAQSVVTSATSYFTPANLTPQNMSIARGIAQGNFSHHSEAGFGIADVGLSLGLGFNYQSFLTEVPDEWKIVEPMGRGWTHSYNAHIFTTITSNDASAKPLLVVAWGDGTFDAYDNTNIPVGFTSTDLPSHASKIGIGNYDILSRPSSTTYTIKKKDQSVITFTSQGEAGLYRMSSVVDKNGNTITVAYKAGTTIPFRVANKVIDYVQAPSGRRATFTYNSDNYITNIAFPGAISTTPRNLTFTYNGHELKTYKDARGQVINKVTTYNYGTGLEAYLLKEIILPKGNKVVNGYNNNRKLINSRVYGSNGAMTNTTTIGHNSIYNTTTTGMDNVSVTNVFNTNGLPATNINASANINITRVYDSNHPTKIASFTSNGVTTTSTYYTNGNIDQINYPASIGGYEKFTFDAYNNPLTHRDAKGIITTMTYPDNKNLGSVTKAVGDGTNITQTFTYWPNGLPKTSTNSEGIVTNFAYNTYGNLNSVNIPVLNLTMTANYDYASRKTSVTNFKNQTSTTTYDENDNVKTETDAQNHTTTMTYDDNDNPSTITNAKGKITTLTYDAFDRNDTQTFEGSTNTYIYDNATNRLTEFRKAGYATDNTRKFVYTYDLNTGLLKSNGYIQNINYDTKNRMSGIRGGNNASHQLDLFTYDDLNRLQSYRDHYQNVVGYGYDLNGNVIRIDYPNGNKLYKTYDNLNRLKTLTWNTTLLGTYNYVGSRLSNIVYGNAVKTTMGYDNAGRPNALDIKTNNGTGSTIFASAYTMDNLGNHLGENETHTFPTMPLPTAKTTTYTVNSLNRLTGASTTTGSTSSTQTYGYDGDGNVNNKGFGNNMTYDIDDNMISYTGNGLTMSAIYDALGNRRSVTRNGTETRYILDINGDIANILAETNSSNVVQNYYIHGLGLVARIKADGTIHYYHADFRGSTIAMTNASQTITHKYQYDEFGNETNKQEADPNPFRYVGAYGIMYETPDLSYMRARYYDPTTGRFNSEDPIWSTNLYPYAGNNGMMNADLNGMKYVELCYGGQATTGVGVEKQECVQISKKGISVSTKSTVKSSTSASAETIHSITFNKGDIPKAGTTKTYEGTTDVGAGKVNNGISINSNQEVNFSSSLSIPVIPAVINATPGTNITFDSNGNASSIGFSFKAGKSVELSNVNATTSQTTTTQYDTHLWKK